jgi:hypothetical protein
LATGTHQSVIGGRGRKERPLLHQQRAGRLVISSMVAARD